MKNMLSLALAATGAAFLAAPAATQTSDRITQLVVYGDDPCPAGGAGEIVVCARKPETERYRIPEIFRGENDPQALSWAARATQFEYVSDTGIQSCSTVGPGGFTGCWAEMMRIAQEERRANPTP